MQQDYTRWEAVIISDDHADYERILADQLVRLSNIQFHTTGCVASGAANARNIGLEHAKGDVIALLDCDDAFEPTYFSDMLPLVKTFGAAVTQIKIIDELSNTLRPNYNITLKDKKILPDQIIRCCFHAMNVAVFDRAKVSHRYMPLEKNEDYIFLMQVFNAVECMGYHPHHGYHYYKHPGSSTAFSPDANVIAKAFTDVAIDIKQQIRSDKIDFKTHSLKEIVISGLDLYIAAQSYFVERARIDPSVKFNEIIGTFLNAWPLPASLRAA